MNSTRLIPNEAPRQLVQSAIDATKTGAERNRLGQFATPNTLAIDIAVYLESLIKEPNYKIHFADPAVGTGSFFSAALRVFGAKRIETAVGVEVDPAFCDAARDLWADAGLKVVCGDFTRIVADESCPQDPNVVLANPPYVRHHHLDREEKIRLQQLTQQMAGVEVNGLAGLYVYFLLLATAWMEEGGYAAWLIPSEFMDVNYGFALRRFLTDRVTLIRAHRFDPADVQFDDAFVSSVVLVFRKNAPPNTHAVEFTFAGTLAEPLASECIPLHVLRESRKWSLHPKHAQSDSHISNIANGSTLNDFFRIQRGIATGNNKFFVLERAVATRLGLPFNYLRPILPSPRHLQERVIESDDDGYPLVEPQLCVIDCNLPEHIVEERYPALWEYLQSAVELGIKDGYLVGKRRPWYRQEQREPPLFLCTYMGRGTNDKSPFRFILNHSQAIGTNLYLMLYPKNCLARMLLDHPDRITEVYEFLTSVTGSELRGEGRVYGGGLHKIEPSELCRISAEPLIERWPELQESVVRIRSNTLFPR